MKENNTYDAIFKYSNILIVKRILIELLKYEPPPSGALYCGPGWLSSVLF